MEAFEEAIALRTPDLSGFVLDIFKLEEKFVRVLVRTATEFAPIVGENSLDGDAVLLEEGQDVIVEEVNGSKRHFRGVEASESEAGMAVDSGLRIDASNALKIADMESVDCHERSRKRRFNVALAELGFKAFEEGDLMLIELEGAFASVLFEPQKALVLG